MMVKIWRTHLAKLRAIADYQFGKGIGVKLFPENIEVQFLHELAEYASST